MRRRHLLWLSALTACATAPPLPPAAAGDPDAGAPPARLVLDDDRIVSFSVPTDLRELPAAARTAVEAVAPDGVLLFCARETGARGSGYRVEKRYEEPVPHERSVLVDARGGVLERSHTLPLKQVPKHVLAAALAAGKIVERAEIVSGPVHEEHWAVVVRDRHGETSVVTIGLEGDTRAVRRRGVARIDR